MNANLFVSRNVGISLKLVLVLILGTWMGTGACSDSSSDPGSREAEPAYDFQSTDGLTATIYGYRRIASVSVPGERSLKLKVPGFAKELTVKTVLQDHPAPLAVVLLGVGGTTEGNFSKVWPSWLAQAGYHVLYFDSPFGISFQKIARQGVSGNVWVEAQSVAKVIDTFLHSPEAQGKITALGVAGYSYGGIQALILGQMALEGRLPFELSGIQAFGPPINLWHTAKILDEWYQIDRPQYTLVELKRMFDHSADTGHWEYEGKPDSAKRAAIVAVFRSELADVILLNDDLYHLKKLPEGEPLDREFVRRDHAETYGFLSYGYEFALPYWESKIGASETRRLMDQSDLCSLLARQPSYTETILAADDPFNMPEDLEAVRRCDTSNRVTILPRGGHMGYMADPWTRAKLLSLMRSLSEHAPATTVTTAERGR